MAKKVNDMCECCKFRSMMAMKAGVLVFLIGALRFYDISWPVTIMVVGALIFLKGLVGKLMKK